MSDKFDIPLPDEDETNVIWEMVKKYWILAALIGGGVAAFVFFF